MASASASTRKLFLNFAEITGYRLAATSRNLVQLVIYCLLLALIQNEYAGNCAAQSTSVSSAIPSVTDELCSERQRAHAYCFDDRRNFNSKSCDANAVQAWLDDYNAKALQNTYLLQLADYQVRTNKSEYTVAKHAQVEKNVTTWKIRKAIEATRFPLNMSIYNASIVTQLQMIQLLAGAAPCDPEVIRKRIQLDGQISLLYDTPYCVSGTCEDRLSYFSKEMDGRGRSYDERLKAWVAFYDSFSIIRKPYNERIKLLNQGARENNYRDFGHFEWFSDAGDERFVDKMIEQMNVLMPFYREIHAYVRYKLAQEYPGRFDPRGPIPAHILRNLWAQSWQGLFPRVTPFVNHSFPDTLASFQLKDKNFNARWLFQQAERFFISLGLYNMTQTFWKNSVFERPNDNRSMSCQAVAMDFYVKDDYRIVMCTEPSFPHLITVHHEMGHIQYFMAYSHLPTVFRTSATTGFHEAIGDTIGLSVSTQEYLVKVGLLEKADNSTEYDINFLMRTALDRVVFLPFAFTMDYWRWQVFNGSISEEEYNRKWWELRLQYGGIVPPVNRDNESYFDPAAKYHLALNVPYIRYFTARILQFQFYKAMCKAAGHVGPLHRCDFFGSKEAGMKLKELMSVGASVAWQDALEKMTGERDISAKALLEYFEPLRTWLTNYIRENKVPVGWSQADGSGKSGASRLDSTFVLVVSLLSLIICGLRSLSPYAAVL